MAASLFLALRGLVTGSGQWLYLKAWGTLRLGHVLSLWAFGTLRDLELDILTFFEGLEAVALNGAVMNEDV